MTQHFSNLNLLGAILCACLRFGNPSPLDSFYPGDFDIGHETVIAESDYRIGDDVHDFGKRYDSDAYSAVGIEGDSGYKKFDDFEKAISGNHRSDGHANHYNNAGGRKSGHAEVANYYKDKDAAVKSSKGVDYAASNSFNKGSKTTGFHKVHHKEEYKKDNKFYDEKQQSGQYRRYGDFGATLTAAAGSSNKGQKYDAGYKNSDYGKRGFATRGSLYDRLKKYNGANGYDGYYGNYGNYKTTGEAEQGQKYAN